MFQMKMAPIRFSIHLTSVISFLLWCLKCSKRMFYAGTVNCINPHSMDSCRYVISVSNGLYDTNTN